MSEFDWGDLGSSIRDLVQAAVDTREFDKLNSNISRTLQAALDGMGSSVREGFQTERREQACALRQPQAARKEPVLFVNVRGSWIGGLILSLAGYILALVFGILCLSFLLWAFLDVWAGLGIWIAAVVFALLTAGFLYMGIRGSARLALTRRFQSYVRVLGGRTFCDLKELAAALGKDISYIRRDVSRMIDRNWFLEGHLDQQETCLIVSHATYQQYLQAEEQRRIRQQEETGGAETGSIPTGVQDVLEAGEAYIKRIRKCNDEIPGEEISAKISRMEQLIRQIFAQVEEHPENVSDIRRLMDYYLPTTVKLLDAYAQLDAQPVQGEYIASSKREIEAALDTLNVAFEKLLDGLFRDTAWDVSSDISVLEAMLAQEGLTRTAFEKDKA